jgi:hypothetical protein
MSDHTLCDKCGKVIDKSQPYLQVNVTELATNDTGGVVVQTNAVTYDYHTNHAPKFSKAEPTEPTEPPVEEPPPVVEPEEEGEPQVEHHEEGEPT